jgi:hypothetical protein
MTKLPANRTINTLFVIAILATVGCSDNTNFQGTAQSIASQAAVSKTAEAQADNSSQASAPSDRIEQPSVQSTVAPAIVDPAIVAPAAVAPATVAPPRVTDIFIHNGPAEDVIELYLNGVKGGRAHSGANTLRVVVKAEGEVHYWSFKVVVKGVEILANAKERWVDGSIPADTILYDQTVSFDY